MAHACHSSSYAQLVVPLVLMVVLFSTTVVSVTHKVGDSVWSIPPTNNFYEKWSSSRAFYPGDFLYFDFESERYNVFEVSGTEYKECNIIDSAKRYDHGPALVPLTVEAKFYFICNLFDYCNLGMHFTVNVIQNKTS